MPDVTQWRYPKVAGNIRIRDARSSRQWWLDGSEKLSIYRIPQMLYTRGWPVGFGFIIDKGTSIILGFALCRGGEKSSLIWLLSLASHHGSWISFSRDSLAKSCWASSPVGLFKTVINFDRSAEVNIAQTASELVESTGTLKGINRCERIWG